jgi:hypothetical protein
MLKDIDILSVFSGFSRIEAIYYDTDSANQLEVNCLCSIAFNGWGVVLAK